MTPVVAYTDGSCRPCINGTGTAAFIALDPAGAVIMQDTLPPFPSANVAVAEMVAIHAAMDWLLANGHYEVCIRTDHLPLVQKLRKGRSFRGAARPYWIAITEWLACFDFIEFEFVPRWTPWIRFCDAAAHRAQQQYRQQHLAWEVSAFA